MRYEIVGSVLPSVDVYLQAGESVYTERGGMAWMRGDVQMETNARGGLMAGLGRKLAGESIFMTTYTCRSGEAMVTFTPEAPGRIMAFNLQAGQSLICQKDAFMLAQTTANIEMHFRKNLGSGLFGGEGFVLQKVSGPGMVFLEIAGDVRDYVLQPGEVMRIDPGHIAFYETGMAYDIASVGSLKNALFSGEGLFLATITGPGHVWLQSMPVSNLAEAIKKYIPTKSS
ncbi:MAG: TIGR00266 family protein [Anaerolineales bacterium]